MTKLRCWPLLLLLTLCVYGRPAAAQSEDDKTTARNLFFEARRALDARSWEEAADLFARSNQTFPAPTAALGLARALAGGGKLVRAYETYTSILHAEIPETASAPFRRAVADAGRERDALEARLPALVVRVDGPAEPTASVDGRQLPRAVLGQRHFVDPGDHVIEVGGAGYASQRQQVSVAEGQTREVAFALGALPKPLVPPASPVPRAAHTDVAVEQGMTPLRVSGLVVGGVGVASLAAAAVTGGLYLSEKATVDGSCREVGPSEFACADASGADAATAGRTYGVINAITLVGGIAATGLGLTLFFLGAREEPVTVRGSARGLEMRGTF